MKRIFVAVLLTVLALLEAAIPAAAATSAPVTAIAMPVLDLHDGMVARFGSRYYAYGTEYACGFTWYKPPTPFCGFGVSTAPSLRGPWSRPKLLFSPRSLDPFTRLTWQKECGGTAQGCFNPRMIQRSGWGVNDHAFVLWFNAPYDVSSRKSTNAYNVMGCNGPAGPCGPTAGAPHGGYVKPVLNFCKANGDFGIIQTPSGPPALVCSMPGAAGLSLEVLNRWGADGSYVGVHNLAGATGVEGDGGYWDPRSRTYIVTFSHPNCGYCTGTGTGFATASSLTGPWTERPQISARSCGGQPRTVSLVNGQAYEGIDLWTGARNETKARWLLEPLDYTAPPAAGRPWVPFAPWNCKP